MNPPRSAAAKRSTSYQMATNGRLGEVSVSFARLRIAMSLTMSRCQLGSNALDQGFQLHD
jgi:hypothetical protein